MTHNLSFVLFSLVTIYLRTRIRTKHISEDVQVVVLQDVVDNIIKNVLHEVDDTTTNILVERREDVCVDDKEHVRSDGGHLCR